MSVAECSMEDPPSGRPDDLAPHAGGAAVVTNRGCVHDVSHCHREYNPGRDWGKEYIGRVAIMYLGRVSIIAVAESREKARRVKTARSVVRSDRHLRQLDGYPGVGGDDV